MDEPRGVHVAERLGKLLGQGQALAQVEALALLAIGMTKLSMSPPSIGPIKEMILGLELAPVRHSVAAALSEGASGVSIRELLHDWAQRQSLAI